ncbi:ABC transporter permease [Roseisalinus antarcticus]|uniref:Glutathione transport system permease protein GsiD n=1 Tax=Roseisalinus antarcticus TaxID=254357 RepID=A0A1Y5T135_9RHOB|nr:ABC transporter permease [Roseisalinus antarcticus]SLN53484.1 Glutathione transport system permease protein GsiD [Roseisalinus antarcticus]
MPAAAPNRPAQRRSRLEPITAIGAAIVLAVLAAGIAAPWLTPWEPTQIDPFFFLEGPNAQHWFGTDGNGMDVFARVLYAARIDIGIALASVALAVVLGTAVGLPLGYAGGWVDDIGMRVLDILQAFPVFILALAIAAILGTSLPNLILTIGLINAPPYARLIRAEVVALRHRTFIEAAECAGNSHSSLMLRHLLPNALTPILVIAPLNCGWAILTLAGLSFVGLGIPVPEAEWGAMISAGAADVVGGRWWTATFPGLALFLTVLGFNLIGEGLQQRQAQR